ncbi:hypothetical protein V1512DRAFT_256540 [Lipomyces arxii]|uniref:uncharacterized protein n=1 Tax=Lipomyces arxii TaxID=56418 RepID=UPI0034CF5ACC
MNEMSAFNAARRRSSLDFNWSAEFESAQYESEYVYGPLISERRQSELFYPSTAESFSTFGYGLDPAGVNGSTMSGGTMYESSTSTIGMIPEYFSPELFHQMQNGAQQQQQQQQAHWAAYSVTAIPQSPIPKLANDMTGFVPPAYHPAAYVPQMATWHHQTQQVSAEVRSDSPTTTTCSHSSYNSDDDYNADEVDDDDDDDEEYKEPTRRSLRYSAPNVPTQNMSDWARYSEGDSEDLDEEDMERKMTQSKKGVYRCNHCSDKFNTMEQFYNHIAAQGVDRQYKCTVLSCPWSRVGFPNRNECNRHIKHQHAGSMYPCPYELCTKKFPRKDSRNRHVKLVHEKPDSRLNMKLERKRIEAEARLRRTAESSRTGGSRFKQTLKKKKSIARLQK